MVKRQTDRKTDCPISGKPDIQWAVVFLGCVASSSRPGGLAIRTDAEGGAKTSTRKSASGRAQPARTTDRAGIANIPRATNRRQNRESQVPAFIETHKIRWIWILSQPPKSSTLARIREGRPRTTDYADEFE